MGAGDKKTLELSLDIRPTSFFNDVKIEENGKKTIYIAKVRLPRFVEWDIVGITILTKYTEEFRKEEIKKWDFSRILPRRVETTKEVKERNCVWRVTGWDSLDPTAYIIKDGKVCEDETGYRGRLKRNGRGSNIILSDELLDMLFRPIDEKLLKIYQDAFDFYKSSGIGGSSGVVMLGGKDGR
jgi:hypothetical protein